MTALSLQVEQNTIKVFSVARETVDHYQSLSKSKAVLATAVSDLKAGAQYFFTVINILMGLGSLIGLIPLVVLASTLLFMTLVYANIVLWGNVASIRKHVASVTREEAINIHLKVERSSRRLNCLANGGIILRLPLIGFLFKRFIKNLAILEAELKQRAYPVTTQLSDLPVHPYDPSDSWQSESEDSDIYEKHYLNK